MTRAGTAGTEAGRTKVRRMPERRTPLNLFGGCERRARREVGGEPQEGDRGVGHVGGGVTEGHSRPRRCFLWYHQKEAVPCQTHTPGRGSRVQAGGGRQPGGVCLSLSLSLPRKRQVQGFGVSDRAKERERDSEPRLTRIELTEPRCDRKQGNREREIGRVSDKKCSAPTGRGAVP